MNVGFFANLKKGILRFRDYPQLWLTVAVAIAIFASFIYVANRFITIAREAQDELVNVRIGALHDAFAPLAGVLIKEPALLREHMQNISDINPTITNFFIVTYDGAVANKWHIMLALDEQMIDTDLIGYDISLNLAASNPGNSFTVEEVRGGERFFRTSRAILDDGGKVIAVAVTRQTLSAADERIASHIRNSVGALVFILLFLLLLFLRHARIIDYTVLYKKLKEVDSMKDDFISMASHELRTPLTSIRGYVDILRGSNEVQSADGQKSLKRIDISAKELDQLIADILDVSRLEQGRLSIKPEEINYLDVVAEVCDSLRITAEAKGLAFNMDLVPQAKITVDPVRLRQISVNLIGNAIKYTQEGSVTVSAKIVGGQLELRVSDTGLGISAEDQKELFKKFWRAGDKETRKQTGTGLGLWITKQLIEQMQGHVSVESMQGVGSHFIVTFPVVTHSNGK